MQLSKYLIKIHPYSLDAIFKVRQGAKFLSIEDFSGNSLVLIMEEDPEAPEVEMEVRCISVTIPEGFSYLGTYKGDSFYGKYL